MLTLFAGILTLQAAASPADTRGAACRKNAPAIREALRRVAEKQKNVGLAAAVSRDGKIVFAENLGFADLEHRVAVTRDTRFGIASITKAFTGAALLKLWETGGIDLDAPIQRYVPSFPVKPEGAITPRLLAAHLAGIRHWKKERTAELYATHFDNVSEILRLFENDPLESAPGTKYSYSSYGYDLLGTAIQAASGKSYTAYVEDAVIRPLHLDATGFDDVRQVLLGRARRYSYYDPVTFEEKTEPVRVPEWDYSHNLAAGNMVSTAEDLARFGGAFVGPGFLSERAWRLLSTRPRTEKAESPMSFGWFVSEKGRVPGDVHTSGSNAGLQAGLYVYPDSGFAVAVLSNTWGVGSRSGEMVSDLPQEIARLCGAFPASQH
jgi:CubicO group peptidase (beta-lactamase class C family)